MLRLYWHCHDLTEAEEKDVADSLTELQQLLKREPLGVDLDLRTLSPDARQIVDTELRRPPDTAEPFRDCYRAISRQLKTPQWAPLIVCCRPGAAIARAARTQGCLALWGLTCDHIMAAVYELGNKYILWHEVLHLWNADDCYSEQDPNGPTTCELPNCIMQYEPTANIVGDWPFLCKQNIKAVRFNSENPLFR